MSLRGREASEAISGIIMLKVSELRNLTKQELEEKAVALKKSLYDMRIQKATGRVEKPGKIREARREIARILTILQEKEG